MKRIHGIRPLAAGLLLCALAAPGVARNATVGVQTELEDATASPVVVVRFAVPADHYLYADRLSVAADPVMLTPLKVPAAKQKPDPVTSAMIDVYDDDIVLRYRPERVPATGITLQVGYQACNQTICFRPMRVTFVLGGRRAGDTPPHSIHSNTPPTTATAESWEEMLHNFRIAGTEAGYAKSAPFIAFLENARQGTPAKDTLQSALDGHGAWLVVVLILVGGLTLNLTPCVLPMIPINIAIIGAGAQAGSRRRGFALGAVYGAGMALVYGLLGVIAVVTGAKFGALNASPWFNLAIAAILVGLSLAMFDVFTIDLSRFQAKAGPKPRGGFIPALLLGGVAALLAGACVAPVLISVLLLAADFYARGNEVGLALPFLLGIGMALPWPFAGAGLSFLPKPGKWMARVKMAFGVLIILFALWYGKLGTSLLLARTDTPPPAQANTPTEQTEPEDGWLTSLDTALTIASETGQPVFIDFWATWCKNCLKMDQTTFKDPEVVAALAPFVRAKIQAEDIAAPQTSAMLDRFNAIGLPTYVVLVPREEEGLQDETTN